jgi:hypothetical protein
MSIELTAAQQQALDKEGPAVRVVDPRTNAGYVLVPADEFESVREVLEDDRRQRAIRRVALRNAAGRVGEEP